MQEVALRRQQQQQQQQRQKQENTRMQQMVAQLHQQQKTQHAPSVSFEPTATAAAVARVNAADRLGRLKSYSPREYAGVLKPRGSDKTPVKQRKVRCFCRCAPVCAGMQLAFTR
jgi:uncharacterized protein YkwD